MVVKKRGRPKKSPLKKTSQKGVWRTPSGNKAKSKFTKQENSIIKKYRQTGSMKSLTPKQKQILLRASFK